MKSMIHQGKMPIYYEKIGKKVRASRVNPSIFRQNLEKLGGLAFPADRMWSRLAMHHRPSTAAESLFEPLLMVRQVLILG